MGCVGKCSCMTQLTLGKEPALLCGICHKPGRLTLGDTDPGGYVCNSKESLFVQHTVADFLNHPQVKTRDIEMDVDVVHDAVTGVPMMRGGRVLEDLPTPDCLAFKIMAHMNILVLPDHKNVLRMTFELITDISPCDDPMTIFIEMSKPIKYVRSEDGSMNTYCYKWEARCLPGGNIRMCQKIPTHLEGPHRVTFLFTDMKQIQRKK